MAVLRLIQFYAPELFLLLTTFIPFETFTYCKVYRHTDTSGGSRLTRATVGPRNSRNLGPTLVPMTGPLCHEALSPSELNGALLL